MTDLKDIPYELKTLLKSYSCIVTTLNNSKETLDLNKIDFSSLKEEELQGIIYNNLYKIIFSQVQMPILHKQIEDILRTKLNISFSELLMWESKIEYR